MYTVARVGTALLMVSASSLIAASPAHDHSNTALKPKTSIVEAYQRGPCDTADVLNMIPAQFAHAPEHAMELMKARIQSCQDIITAYQKSVPTPATVITNANGLLPPSPLPTPNPACSPLTTNVLLKEYAMLGYCVGWIAHNVPSASLPPTASPAPVIFHTPQPAAKGQTETTRWQRAVYVMALAADAPTSAQISYEMVAELAIHVNPSPSPDPYTGWPVQYTLVPAPTWTISQYQQQCFSDPSTAGAIVAMQPSVDSAAWNYVLTGSWTEIGWQTMVLDCEPTNTAYVNNSSFITWVESTRPISRGTRYSFSLSAALGIVSGFLAFHPARTLSYTTVAPAATPPGSTYQSGYSVTNNQYALAAAGAAFLSPQSSTNIGDVGGVDAQTAKAIKQVMPVVISDILMPCTATVQASTGTQYTPPGTRSVMQCVWLK